MEIGFIYPDLDTDLFVDSIDSFNSDISLDNKRTFLPRAAVLVLNIFVYVVWALIVRGLFSIITYYVTAKRVTVIGLCLFAYLLGIIASLQGLSALRKKLRPKLLKLFRGEEAEESYSFSAYVERKDGKKLARRDVGFYKMCDTLKRSKIVDATAVCDGSQCKVEVAFENESESSVYTFFLEYHDGDVDKVIVDLIRKCVIFPKEEKTDENNKIE